MLSYNRVYVFIQVVWSFQVYLSYIIHKICFNRLSRWFYVFNIPQQVLIFNNYLFVLYFKATKMLILGVFLILYFMKLSGTNSFYRSLGYMVFVIFQLHLLSPSYLLNKKK